MEPLLVLILTVDPSVEPVAKALQGQLAAGSASAASAARVVMGAPALTALKEHGLRDADLLELGDKPLAATGNDPRLVLVRIERRQAGSRETWEGMVWARGRREAVTALRPTSEAPPLQLAGQLAALVAPAMPAGAQTREQADIGRCAPFLERADWAGLLKAAGQGADSPRLGYYRVLAQVRLGDWAAARAAGAALAKTFPGAPATAEAAALLAEDEGGKALRDGSGAADDGGKTLR